ncbi:MAG: adenylyltransferase/cytidyltransferase family protein [Chloroflexi bacterium]|nr:adenylyltransferase/cytidyltransferase family protein [Chloroflexota bacterium]
MERLLARCAARRFRGQRIVLTNGCFDLLHVGHVRSLAAARQVGDCLVVGVNDDESVRRLKGPTRPIVPATERAELIAALACVDEVVVFGGPTAVELVQAVRPEVYVKGDDYGSDGKPLPEADVVESYGGRVALLALVPGRSTSDLIATILGRGRATGRRGVWTTKGAK